MKQMKALVASSVKMLNVLQTCTPKSATSIETQLWVSWATGKHHIDNDWLTDWRSCGLLSNASSHPQPSQPTEQCVKCVIESPLRAQPISNKRLAAIVSFYAVIFMISGHAMTTSHRCNDQLSNNARTRSKRDLPNEIDGIFVHQIR